MFNMGGKKRWLVLSIVGLLVGLILGSITEYTDFCRWPNQFCEFIDNVVMQPFVFLSLAVLFALVILFFLKTQVFLAWHKFALWYLPIAFGLIILTALSSSSSDMGIDLFSIDSEQVTWLTSGLFLLISVVLVIYKSYSLRSK